MAKLDNVLKSTFHTYRHQEFYPIMARLLIILSIFQNFVQKLTHVKLLNIGINKFYDGQSPIEQVA
jgi:hypothetical protein